MAAAKRRWPNSQPGGEATTTGSARTPHILTRPRKMIAPHTIRVGRRRLLAGWAAPPRQPGRARTAIAWPAPRPRIFLARINIFNLKSARGRETFLTPIRGATSRRPRRPPSAVRGPQAAAALVVGQRVHVPVQGGWLGEGRMGRDGACMTCGPAFCCV